MKLIIKCEKCGSSNGVFTVTETITLSDNLQSMNLVCDHCRLKVAPADRDTATAY